MAGRDLAMPERSARHINVIDPIASCGGAPASGNIGFTPNTAVRTNLFILSCTQWPVRVDGKAHTYTVTRKVREHRQSARAARAYAPERSGRSCILYRVEASEGVWCIDPTVTYNDHAPVRTEPTHSRG